MSIKIVKYFYWAFNEIWWRVHSVLGNWRPRKTESWCAETASLSSCGAGESAAHLAAEETSSDLPSSLIYPSSVDLPSSADQSSADPSPSDLSTHSTLPADLPSVYLPSVDQLLVDIPSADVWPLSLSSPSSSAGLLSSSAGLLSSPVLSPSHPSSSSAQFLLLNWGYFDKIFILNSWNVSITVLQYYLLANTADEGQILWHHLSKETFFLNTVRGGRRIFWKLNLRRGMLKNS